MVSSSIRSRHWARAAATVLATAASALASPIAAADGDNCHCYLTDGSAAAYFTHHQFLDFRSVADPRTPDPIGDRAGATNAGSAHPFFDAGDFGSTWSVQAWVSAGADATVWNTYSKNDVYIAADPDAGGSSTYMTLRTHRHAGSGSGDFQESAEVQTVSGSYQHVSLRMYARTRGSAGAVTAMFTYRGGATEADVQEADLEVLTTDADTLAHYTNQPSQVSGEPRPGAAHEVTIPAWSEWREHRLDWTPGSVTWYVDGAQVEQNSFQAPVDPATLLLNVWSDGGSWSGVMPQGQEAAMDVRWLEVLFNNTDQPSQFEHCANVCSIDVGGAPGEVTLVSSGP
ncbi:glycoside hydrolase family 16 protein [Hypoxylon sp. FL1284]|nr:glycoside hydrolase family 16 protein [Hypoxylon sp. FL1284]